MKKSTQKSIKETNKMLSRVSARSYSTAVNSIKTVTKDSAGHLTKLTVVVDNAGSKAGKSGEAHLLSKFNFLNTASKSALRFTRESELLGGIVSSKVTRDAIILKTEFLKEDLPFYVQELGNVLTKTSFRPHEFTETVLPVAKAEYEAAHASNVFKAFESLHELSFRKGLGQPLYYDGLKKITVDDVKEFASSVYNTSNVTVYATGASEADLSNFINESAFSSLPQGSSSSIPVHFHTDKEARIKSAGENVAIIAIPVKPSDFGAYQVLSAALGNVNLPGASNPLSKIPGASSKLLRHKEAGLFLAGIVNPDPSVVASGIRDIKKTLESVASSDLSSAVKPAKLSSALESSFDSPSDFEISSPGSVNVKQFNYVAVGDLDVLPYADEL